MITADDVDNETQALRLLTGEGPYGHSPTPPRMTCAAQYVDLDTDDGGFPHGVHVCGLTEHDDKVRHACKDCPTVWPLPHSPTVHSRRITDRLLAARTTDPTEEVVALSPTVEATVTRDPASEAIATATRRMVHRTGQTIAQAAEAAWRRELPDLEIRIATRLEDAGLPPSVVRRITDVVIHDVRSTATLTSEAIEAHAVSALVADVARNLLPRINKVMKETDHG